MILALGAVFLFILTFTFTATLDDQPRRQVRLAVGIPVALFVAWTSYRFYDLFQNGPF